MSTNQESKTQLVINANPDGTQNVILNGVLLFNTNSPDIEDILDAYGLTPNNTTVLVDGLFNDTYITKKMNDSVTFEKPQIDENILDQIAGVTFDSNSEQLLKSAGVDPVYAVHGSEVPVEGEVIYIPSQNSVFSNINGGKATVTEVIERANVHYIAVNEVPNTLYRWSEIAFYQQQMAEEFGETVASIVSTY